MRVTPVKTKGFRWLEGGKANKKGECVQNKGDYKTPERQKGLLLKN